jgi:hypothetical protein
MRCFNSWKQGPGTTLSYARNLLASGNRPSRYAMGYRDRDGVYMIAGCAERLGEYGTKIKEGRERGKEGVGRMIDLAGLFRNSARTLINRDRRLGIDSWAPFVYSGYWMYPRVNVQVRDSDEEDV